MSTIATSRSQDERYYRSVTLSHPVVGVVIDWPDEHHDGFEVWLDTGVRDVHDAYLGKGATRQEAVQQAVTALEWALDVLNGPPPDHQVIPPAGRTA